MTKIEKITNVLNIVDNLKSATVKIKIEEMRGIRVEFEDESGDIQTLKANLDPSDMFYLWGELSYYDLINELGKHTK